MKRMNNNRNKKADLHFCIREGPFGDSRVREWMSDECNVNSQTDRTFNYDAK